MEKKVEAVPGFCKSWISPDCQVQYFRTADNKVYLSLDAGQAYKKIDELEINNNSTERDQLPTNT